MAIAKEQLQQIIADRFKDMLQELMEAELNASLADHFYFTCKFWRSFRLSELCC